MYCEITEQNMDGANINDPCLYVLSYQSYFTTDGWWKYLKILDPQRVSIVDSSIETPVFTYSKSGLNLYVYVNSTSPINLLVDCSHWN